MPKPSGHFHEQSRVMAYFCAGQHRSWKLKRDFKRAVWWANQMSQLVKVPAAEPNLSLIPGTTVVGENQLPQIVFWHTCTCRMSVIYSQLDRHYCETDFPLGDATQHTHTHTPTPACTRKRTHNRPTWHLNQTSIWWTDKFLLWLLTAVWVMNYLQGSRIPQKPLYYWKAHSNTKAAIPEFSA